MPTSYCSLVFAHCDCTTLLLSVNMTKSIWILALWQTRKKKKTSLLPVKQLIRLSLCPLWCYFLVYKQSPIITHDKKRPNITGIVFNTIIFSWHELNESHVKRAWNSHVLYVLTPMTPNNPMWPMVFMRNASAHPLPPFSSLHLWQRFEWSCPS